MFASLRTVTAPAVEPVEIDLVRQHCRVDAGYDDALLTMYATSARRLVEGWLNRALITQELLYTITNSPPPIASPLVPQSLIVFPLNWPPLIRRPISLPRAPCTELKSVAWGQVGEIETADPELYTANLEVEPAQIMIHPSMVPMIPAASVQFQYLAGYGADGTTVPPEISHAILMLTAFLYESRGDVAGDMPSAAFALITPYRLWQFAG